ncbi:MAG: hypothetical protein RBT66_07720, partial [bacterium]|nr:hypothetical protein [bacterium]
AGTITLNLGGSNRLRISPSGIQGSDDSGSTWYDIIATDSGKVVITGDVVKAGTIVTSHLAADAVSSLTTDSSASGSFGSSLVDATVSKSGGYFRVVARGRVKSNGNDEVYVYLKRGSTTIATWSKWCGNANYEDFAFNVAESPSDGSTTYSITISGTSYGGAYQSLSLEVEYHKR